MEKKHQSTRLRQDFCLVMPILPGRAEAWRRFVQELQGPHWQEWEAWRRRVGVGDLQFWLQSTDQHSVVWLQGKISQKFGQTPVFYERNKPFDRWLYEQLLLLHGIDLAQLSQLSVAGLGNYR